MRFFSSFIFISVILLSLSQQVLSQITANPDSGCAPLGVTFSPPAGASNPQWDFGDGSSSNQIIPVHTYSPGTYTVRFTGTVAGNTVNYTTTVHVFAAPDAAFTALTPTKGCTGLTVNFQDASTGSGGSTISGWEWTFGDGGFNNSNDPTPSYTFNLPGVFDVRLIVLDNFGCKDTATTLFISTSTPPDAIIRTPDPTSACNPPLTINFFGDSSRVKPSATSLSYQWDFGNGAASSLINPLPVTYNADGTYDVRLIVTDNNGCASTATKVVSIGSPVASFSAAGEVNDTVCSFVTFINNSVGGSYLYDYGDGSTGITDTHTYSPPGEYFVKLRVVAGQCSDDTTIRIVVEEIVARFKSIPHYSCRSPFTVQYFDSSTNAVDWLWFFGDGEIHTVRNPTHTFTLNDTDRYFIYPEQTYDDMLLVTSPHGCTDTFFVPMNDSLFRPTALFSIDTAEGCNPLLVTFTDSSLSFDSIVTFTWDFDDGTIVSGPDSIVTHTFTSPGDYYTTLIIENERGCKDTSYQIHIRVGLPPRPNFSIDTNVVCPNVPVQFTDLTPPGDSVDTWHYDTDRDWMSACYTEPNPAWSFSSDTGYHDILLTAGYNGCYADTVIQGMIRVLGPIARFEAECVCDTPFRVQFKGEIKGVDTLVWDFGDGNILPTTTEYNPVHTYTATGDYVVKLTGYNLTSGCAPYVTTKIVNVRDLKADFASDSIFCAGVPEVFNASISRDVWEFCDRGYRWVFEEGITPPIRTENPSVFYAFQTSGAHEITLVVRDINECYDTIRKTVNVYGVKADFIADTTVGCVPLTVTFNDTSTADTTIASYLWTFGDGTTDTVPDVTHTYSDTFRTRLRVTDILGCSDTQSVEIKPSKPLANFLPIDSRCEGSDIRFIATIPGFPSYEWAFGDGDSATGQLVSNAFTVAGTYTVSLTVTDGFGCADDTSKNISIQGTPNAKFVTSVDTLAALCYPITINFTDSSTVNPNTPLTRIWDLGSGTPTIGAPTVGETYSQPGSYTITLVSSTSFGCKDTFSRVMVVRGPRGDFDISRDTVCKGESITFSIKDTFDVFYYTWDFGDGTDTNNVSPISHSYDYHPPSGQTFAQLIIYSEGLSCPQTKTRDIYIYQVVADFNRNNETSREDTSHCLGISDFFTNLSQNADSWEWDLGDGTTYSNGNPPDHTYPAPGIYDVSLSVVNNTLGCPDTIVKRMLIHTNPVAASAGGAACEGDSVQLNASGGAVYVWVPPTGLSDDSIPNPIASPSSTTEYTVTVIDTNGCTDDTTVVVRIYEEPDSLAARDTIVIGDSVQLVPPLADDTGYTFIWSPDIELSCLDCPKPFAGPFEDQLYTVHVKDVLGCFDVPSTFEVIVLPLTSVDVPSAFTPNGDFVNDTVYVRGWGIKKLLEFKIYNRWGQLVFEVTNLENGAWNRIGWDGTYLGKEQNMDSYAYQVSVLTWIDDKVLRKSGFISLLR